MCERLFVKSHSYLIRAELSRKFLLSCLSWGNHLGHVEHQQLLLGLRGPQGCVSLLLCLPGSRSWLCSRTLLWRGFPGFQEDRNKTWSRQGPKPNRNPISSSKFLDIHIISSAIIVLPLLWDGTWLSRPCHHVRQRYSLARLARIDKKNHTLVNIKVGVHQDKISFPRSIALDLDTKLQSWCVLFLIEHQGASCWQRKKSGV